MGDDQSQVQQGEALYTAPTEGEVPAEQELTSIPEGAGEQLVTQGTEQSWEQQTAGTEAGFDPNAPPPPPPPGGPLSNIVSMAKRFAIPAILILVALILIFFFLRILRGNTVIKKDITLIYWTLWEDDQIFAPLVDSYHKDHPNVTISVVKQTPKEYRERLVNAILKGEGPDIFRFHNTWLPMLIQSSVITSVPEKVLPGSEIQNSYYPVVDADLRQGSAYYGIPLSFDALGLYYNKAILKAAGEKPPDTWEKMRKVAQNLTVRDPNGRIRTAGVALGTTNNIEFWSDILGLMMLQNSASIINPQGANAEDALAFYSLYARKPDNTWDATLDNSVLAFAGEKVAMIFAPSWTALEIKAINPQLDFGIAPVPQLPTVNTAWATYWVEGVSSKSQNQLEAFEFLKYLSAKENVTRLYSEEAKSRLFGEPYARNDLAATLKGDGYLDAIVTQGPYAKSGYLSSRTYDNGLNDRIIKYYENAVNDINRGSSPVAAIETARRGITQVLSDFGLAEKPAP